MEKLIENVKLICLQTPIWKVSCHRSIISGLLGSFNGKWQGFSMVCSESELRLVDIVYISWLNKISSKGQIGSTCMGLLSSEITFAKKKNISRSKTALVLYIIPSMFWDVWKRYGIFYFQSLEISVLFNCSPGIRNYICKFKISSRKLSNTS